MSQSMNIGSIALATMAAGIFAFSAPVMAESSDSSQETVHCVGVNACKGKSSCAGADNSCGGQNSCKGKGYVEMSKKACEQIGGKAESA